jgi:hypothetical protein
LAEEREMGKVAYDIAASLDGFVAGLNDNPCHQVNWRWLALMKTDVSFS